MIAVFILSIYGLAQRVKFDYDKSADFAKFKTYAWIKRTPAANPNLDLYIMGAVDHDLGLKELTRPKPSTPVDWLWGFLLQSFRHLSCGKERRSECQRR
jgi:hypothetical protein